MIVKFYKSENAPNDADKVLSGEITKNNVHPVHPCNILQPTLEIDTSTALYSYNYAYIPDFGKYYFMSPPTLTTGGKMIVQLNVDVLKTYADSIRQCPATILRNERVPVNACIDSKLPVDANKFYTEGIKFTSTPFKLTAQTLGQKPYILIVR